ncbi:MAG: calcium-binding protein [Nitrosomonas sp.]
MAIINGTQFNDNNTLNGGVFHFSLIGTSDSDIINGLAGNDILDGRDGGDQLKGGIGKDILRGGNGNDSLDGGTGMDNMNGGDGIDTYFVDNAGDVAAETNNTAAGGFDTVIATVSHTLGFAIEDLSLSGNASINGKGNDKDNHIVGNGAANILNGAAGADRMIEGNGNDTYIVDNIGDVVIEDFEDPVAGIDTVNASVDFSLSSGINNLKLTGIGAIDGFGSELNNIISGNGAANFIDAGLGNDTINSGIGNVTY